LNAPEAPPFDEPWQAQVFAMAVALNERGLFDWSEWAEALGAEIAAGPPEAGNEAYFQAGLRALEKILVAKGATGTAELAGLAQAWRAAALGTPHGQPILLGGPLNPAEAGHSEGQGPFAGQRPSLSAR
jgi:nitrile hydratase accessory protein